MSGLRPNAFIGHKSQPGAAELSGALGPAKPAWDELVEALAATLGVTVQEWKCYSAKAGWSLRLLRGKRTVVWLSPYKDCFGASFVMGEKAMAAARDEKLPARVRRLLDEGERYPEGTAIRLLVKDGKEIPSVLTLAGVKIRN